ncbi:MAG: acetyl-CoA carboxylase biotin carboxylase subunit family protein [Anaerolineales bacterium]
MNFVFLSPHYPPNYVNFSLQLKMMGANVLGLADESYDNLPSNLRMALTEYYRVDSLSNYDQLLRALGYFTHRYGKVDRLDSLNEFWLETEAQLRTDFNITGLKTNDIMKIKRKSEMKKIFKKAGIAVAAGVKPGSEVELHDFIAQVGYPLVAKPDIGVGANATYKLHNETELKQFLQKNLHDYIIEEFVEGEICTFDGLTDQDGNIVFYTSHIYQRGIMETVNERSDIYYYSLREIPPDLEIIGRKTVKAFNVRERFFHFEYFRKPDDTLIALEVNIRPPGGLTTDMMNFANDFDIYREWANVLINNRFDPIYTRPYHCCYACRRFHYEYVNSHEQIMSRYSHLIPMHQPILGAWSVALGDHGYLIRSSDLEEIIEVASFIQEKTSEGQ